MVVEVVDVTIGNIVKVFGHHSVPEKFYAGPFEVRQKIDELLQNGTNRVEVMYKGLKIVEFFTFRPEFVDEKKKEEFRISAGEFAYITNAHFVQDIHVSWTDRGPGVEGWALKIIFDTEAFIVKTLERPESPGTVRVVVWKLIDKTVKEDEDPVNRTFLVGDYAVTILKNWDPGNLAEEIKPDDETKRAVVFCFEKTNQVIGVYKLSNGEWIVDLHNEDNKLYIKKQYYRKVVEEAEFSRVLIRKVAIYLGKKEVLLS